MALHTAIITVGTAFARGKVWSPASHAEAVAEAGRR